MKSAFFCILFFSFLTCEAQHNQIRQLDKLFESSIKPGEPGAVVLISKKGKIFYQKAIGSAHLELDIPLREDMVFKIASITKQFTAVAILQLAEKGKLSLNDSIQQFLPDFPYKGHPITIEQLLTHTSGIKDYLQIDFKTPFLERMDFTPQALIDSFKNYPLEFEPGTAYKYSNSGYAILGYVIEKISEKKYQEYIQENLLLPLELTNTRFETESNLIPKRVNGYRKAGNVFMNEDFWSMSIAYAAGGLFSNTLDLYKWHQGLYSNKIIRKETVEKAWKPYRLKSGEKIQYGYGWMLLNLNTHPTIEHGGSFNGFLTIERYFPQEDIYLVILCNYQEAPINQLIKEASEIVLGDKLQANLSISEKELQIYQGVYSLSSESKRSITIEKKNDYLVARTSEGQTFRLFFESDSVFTLEGLTGVKGEFIKTNDVVTKIRIIQNGIFDWIKVN